MAVALTGFVAISLGLRLAAPMLVRPQTLTFPAASAATWPALSLFGGAVSPDGRCGRVAFRAPVRVCRAGRCATVRHGVILGGQRYGRKPRGRVGDIVLRR
jgi:hypothetical protein